MHILKCFRNSTEFPSNEDTYNSDHSRLIKSKEKYQEKRTRLKKIKGIVNNETIPLNKNTVMRNNQCIRTSSFSTINKYRDLANVPADFFPKTNYKNMRGRCQETFPSKLFKILQNSDIGGYSSIISWLPHGRAFKIHNCKLFEQKIMRKYFHMTKIDSFKRQLYMYGFQKIGKRFTDPGAYFNELFLSSRLDLCEHIVRCADPSSSTRPMILLVPNFYKLPPLVQNPTTIESGPISCSSRVDNSLTPTKAHELKLVRYENAAHEKLSAQSRYTGTNASTKYLSSGKVSKEI